jgi:hypothetical protein
MWFYFHKDGYNSCWLVKPNTTPPLLFGVGTGYVRTIYISEYSKQSEYYMIWSLLVNEQVFNYIYKIN